MASQFLERFNYYKGLYDEYLDQASCRITSISTLMRSTYKDSSRKSLSESKSIIASVCSSEKITKSSWDIRKRRSLSASTLRALGKSEQRIRTMALRMPGLVY